MSECVAILMACYRYSDRNIIEAFYIHTSNLLLWSLFLCGLLWWWWKWRHVLLPFSCVEPRFCILRQLTRVRLHHARDYRIINIQTGDTTEGAYHACLSAVDAISIAEGT